MIRKNCNKSKYVSCQAEFVSLVLLHTHTEATDGRRTNTMSVDHSPHPQCNPLILKVELVSTKGRGGLPSQTGGMKCSASLQHYVQPSSELPPFDFLSRSSHSISRERAGWGHQLHHNTLLVEPTQSSVCERHQSRLQGKMKAGNPSNVLVSCCKPQAIAYPHTPGQSIFCIVYETKQTDTAVVSRFQNWTLYGGKWACGFATYPLNISKQVVVLPQEV